jgi:hypothetical protein
MLGEEADQIISSFCLSEVGDSPLQLMPPFDARTPSAVGRIGIRDSSRTCTAGFSGFFVLCPENN